MPYVRGRERSLPTDILMEELRTIAASGFREVVLLGQTVNAYRHDGVDFGELLRRCADVDGIERVRFTSPHPADMTESAIEAIRDCPQVSPYIHLPLQSGSDTVLAAMDRGHTVSEYKELVSRLHDAVPEISFSTDIIVGYPGETEKDFEATSAMMEEISYDHAFLFKYSAREGTRAYKIAETVSEEEKGLRLQRLIAEQERRSLASNQRAVGLPTEVLVEGPAKRQDGWMAGKNPQFKTVVFEPGDARPGDLVTVGVSSATSHTLVGRQACS